MAFENFRNKFNRAKDKIKEYGRDIADGASGIAFVGYLRTSFALVQFKEKLFPSFWTSIEEGDAARVEEALKKKPALATELLDETEKTAPLHAAAAAGQVAVAAILLAHGARLDARDYRDVTPLLIASGHGDKDMVALFLRHNDPTLNQPGYDGSTAVIAAAEGGHAEVVKLMVDNGARLDILKNDGGGASALSVARDRLKFAAHYAEFEKIADLNATINYLEANIEKLLTGADKDINARTPILRACEDRDIDFVKFILENDKYDSVNKAYRYDDSPTLMHGVKETVRFVETALKEAVVRGTPEMVRLLLQHGAKQDIDYEGDKTPLMEAAVRKKADILKILLDNDAGTINNLHVQMYAGILSAKRVDFVHSALTYAVEAGNAGCVALLLERGARQDLPTSKSPLEIAREKGMPEIAALLDQYGTIPAPAAPSAPKPPARQ